MTDERFAILDPAAGISGDMVLGALLAAGAPAEWLRALPRRLGCPDVAIEIHSVRRAGLAAIKVDVVVPSGHHDRHETVAHEHTGAPHRQVSELIAMIEGAELSPWVRQRAIRAFRLLAEAEGQIHGVPADKVALHEVGALDALIDIVGGIEGFERLNIRRIYHWPVSVGSGWVEAAHGALPVPAPATTLLLHGLEIAANGPVTGEATTPTGAALLRVLSAGAPPERWRPIGQGWGAGTRDPARYPNALRLLLATPAAEAGMVALLSADIDDLNPEYLAPLRGALMDAGALEVQSWPTLGKKERHGIRLEVVASLEHAEAVTLALFRHSTTVGIRREVVERVTLPRRTITVRIADDVTVRVKVVTGPGGLRTKPEYDDVIAAAQRLGQPALELAEEVGRLARQQLSEVPRASGHDQADNVSNQER